MFKTRSHTAVCMAVHFLSALMSQAIMLPKGPITKCWFYGCRGFAAAVSLVFFYTGPLSTLVKVMKHKDSSSLNPPFSVMVFMNVIMWLSYGLVRDPHSIPHALNPSCTQFFMHSIPHALNPWCTQSLMHSMPHWSAIMHSLPHALTPSCTQSLMYSTLHALNPSCTQSLTHSIPHALNHHALNLSLISLWCTLSVTHSLTDHSILLCLFCVD